MYKCVDGPTENLEGFFYTNRDGYREVVKLGSGGAVAICTQGDNQALIWNSAIPKLVRALQAAYKHLEENLNEL